MEHPARKITQIAREAEHIVLLAMRQDEIGTAEIDCIHALRHHPGITQTELAGMLHARPSPPSLAERPAWSERATFAGSRIRKTAAVSCSLPRRRPKVCATQRPKRRALFTII